MPSPRKNESEKDFVARCVPAVLEDGTTKDPEQASAICHSMWRNRNKRRSSGQEMLMDALDRIKDQQNDTGSPL
jgi:hypothetical protein